MDQGAGQAELLLHPAGEIARQAPFERRQVAEGQQPFDLFGTPSSRHAVDVGVEVDVLHHGQIGIEAEALAHVADLFLDRLGLAHRVPPHDPGFTGGRVHDGGEHAHGGGLAGAVRPDEAEDLTLGDGKIEAVHGRKVVETLGQVVGLYDGKRGVHFPVPGPPAAVPVRISASAGMPGFSSMFGLGMVILTR